MREVYNSVVAEFRKFDPEFADYVESLAEGVTDEDELRQILDKVRQDNLRHIVKH